MRLTEQEQNFVNLFVEDGIGEADLAMAVIRLKRLGEDPVRLLKKVVELIQLGGGLNQVVMEAADSAGR